MCMGATSGIGRLIAGKVADLPRVNRVRLQQLSFVIIGLCAFLIPLAKSFWILVVIVLVMGFFDGCFVCMFGPIAFDLVGAKDASHALGFIFGAISIPMTAGPPIAGTRFEGF